MRGYKLISFEQFCELSNCRGHIKHPNGMYRCLGHYRKQYCQSGSCTKWRKLSCVPKKVPTVDISNWIFDTGK